MKGPEAAKHYPVGPPYVLHRDDWLKLTPSWVEFVPKVRGGGGGRRRRCGGGGGRPRADASEPAPSERDARRAPPSASRARRREPPLRSGGAPRRSPPRRVPYLRHALRANEKEGGPQSSDARRCAPRLPSPAHSEKRATVHTTPWLHQSLALRRPCPPPSPAASSTIRPAPTSARMHVDVHAYGSTPSPPVPDTTPCHDPSPSVTLPSRQVDPESPYLMTPSVLLCHPPQHPPPRLHHASARSTPRPRT